MFAVDIDSPKVMASGAIGNEYDIAAVGTDGGFFVETSMGSELPGWTMIEIADPQILLTAGRQRVDDLIVGRPRQTKRTVVVGKSKLRAAIHLRRRRNPDVGFLFGLDRDQSAAI